MIFLSFLPFTLACVQAVITHLTKIDCIVMQMRCVHCSSFWNEYTREL